MAGLELNCRVATPFKKNGDLDEEALRKLLQRFKRSKIGIYLGSVNGGESRVLSPEELRRTYEIGLDECRGRIAVNANPPDGYSARARREYLLQAIDAGVDMVMINFYNTMRLGDAEVKQYFKEVLAGIRHPMAIAINKDTPKAEVMADICNEHRQIAAFNISHGGDGYFVKFMDRLKRDVPVFVQTNGSLTKLAMGARGVFGTEANILPKTQKAYVDAVAGRNQAAIARNYAHMIRYGSYMSQWFPLNPRAVKMAFRLFKLPGWEGGLHRPYLDLPDKDYRRFAAGMLRLGIPEITEQARAAGVRMPK